MGNIIKYIAFLRGINVGGRKIVKMEELKKAFESLGLKNAKTFLASGNVLFDAQKTDLLSLGKRIEEGLKKKFGLEVNVILRTVREIQELADSNPFIKITVTPQTRLYVTFLSERPKAGIRIPYETPEKDFKIVHVSDFEVCSVLTLSPNRGTVDAMSILEKTFGRNV